MGKTMSPPFLKCFWSNPFYTCSFIFDRIIIKVAGNQDRHNSSVEFDFSCSWMTKILHFLTWISLRPVGHSWSNFMCSITGVGKRCTMFWGRLDQNSGVSTFFSVAFDPILFILAGNKDMHKISDEFKFWPDQTTDYGVSCPWASKRFQTYNEKMVSPC